MSLQPSFTGKPPQMSPQSVEWLSTPQKSAEMNTPEMIEKRRQARIAYWRRNIEFAKAELRALGETEV